MEIPITLENSYFNYLKNNNIKIKANDIILNNICYDINNNISYKIEDIVKINLNSLELEEIPTDIIKFENLKI